MAVRGVFGRALAVAGAFAATVALSIGLTPVAAAAAPAAKPTTMHISGRFAEEKLTVQAADDVERFQKLLAEVSWLANAAPNTTAPAVDKLGPKFTLVVLVKESAQQTYDMYPLAAGGPRAFRPAKQPNNKKVAAGWFYGRLSMSESLRINGVPLAEKRDSVSGGIGGGERIDLGEELDPAAGVTQFFGEMRQLVLLNGAVVLSIAVGLAGIAFLIRRKV